MTRNEQIETAVLQRQAARLVEREVHACMSTMVAALIGGIHDCSGPAKMGQPLRDMIEQAFELASPIPDYEEAAREAGWIVGDSGLQFVSNTLIDEETGLAEAHGDFQPMPGPSADDWRDLCEAYGYDAYDRDVFEHWAVSSWLADKLEAKGEKVDRDFAGLNVWARTTTGQAISIDGVIEAIVRETGYASADA